MPPQRFCSFWLISLAAMLAIVAGFDAAVDPYGIFGIPRIAGFNQVKPDASTHLLMSKTYQVERVHPVTVLLGTSRADLGFDPASPVWPASLRPVFNYGVPGAGLTTVFATLREAAATGQLANVVMLVEFESFWFPESDSPQTDEDGDRFLLSADGTPNPHRLWQRLRDGFLATLTTGALADSIDTVLGQHSRLAPDLTELGLTTEGGFERQAADNGYYGLFAAKRQQVTKAAENAVRGWAGNGGEIANMQVLRAIASFCRSRHIGLTLVIPPYNAGLLTIYRRAGLGDAYARWKHAILAQASDSVAVWDFGVPGPYTSELPPTDAKDGLTLRWYWEYVHFKRALGEKILARIIGASDEPFGIAAPDAGILGTAPMTRRAGYQPGG